MANCACHTEIRGWSFESFWREESSPSPCGAPDCGRSGAGAERIEEHTPLTRRATLGPTIGALPTEGAPTASAERVAVGLTIATLSFGAMTVLATVLHYVL